MIKTLAVIALILAGTFSSMSGQALPSVGFEHITLLSPWVFAKKGKVPNWDPRRATQSCLDVRTLKYGKCPGAEAIVYGNRVGDPNWDVFTLGISFETQTRYVDIGAHNWGDNFEVPYLRPYARLRPGETRALAVNTFGRYTGKAADEPKVRHQISSERLTPNGAFDDNYVPFVSVEAGHMYLVRVLDPKTDFYFIFRVDHVDHGDKVDISFKKVPSPKAPVF